VIYPLLIVLKSWPRRAPPQGRPYRGAREGHVPSLENVENLGKLLIVIRIYLFI